MCCANGGWHADGQDPPGFSMNDDLAGGLRVLNPNDGGGVDSLSEGAHHGQSDENFTAKIIPAER